MAMQHTLTFAVDGIITGKIYSLRTRSMNVMGYSDYSEVLYIAASSPPAQPATPQVQYSLSNRTSLFVSWELNDDGIVPGGQIAGYILYIDDGYGGDFKPIFNSVGLTS